MHYKFAVNHNTSFYHSGHITVMLSLMLSTVIIFMVTVSEGVAIYLNKARTHRSLITSSESVMADYNRFLWDRYRILAVDEGYSTDNANAIGIKFNEYMLDQMPEANRMFTSLYRFTVDEVGIAERARLIDDTEYLKNEIRELMKYEIAEDGIDKILKSLDLEEDESEVNAAKNDVINSKNNEAKSSGEMSSASKDADANEEGKDPRKAFSKAIKKGTLALVLGDGNVSDTDYELRDLFDDPKVNDKSIFKEKTKLRFKEADELTDMLEVDNKSSLKDDGINLALTVQYIKDYYKHYDKTASGDFVCEQEYLIAGKGSDLDNLKVVVNKILALRFVTNYLYVSKSIEHQTEAKEMATALVGATGNVAAIEVVSYLLLAVLAYSESVVDVRSLLKGKRVALIPNATTFKLNMKNMISALIGSSVTETKVDRGVSYEDYLTFFIVTNHDSELKYKRMITLMDSMGRKDDERFDMNRMLFSYKVNAKVSPVSIFGGRANAVSNTSYTLERTVSY